MNRADAMKNTIGFQRAENGVLDPSWLDLAFLGHPDFQSRGPKLLFFWVLGSLDGNRGAPKMPKPTTTDSTAPTLGPLLGTEKVFQ